MEKITRFLRFCKTEKAYLSYESILNLKGVFIIVVLAYQLYQYSGISGSVSYNTQNIFQAIYSFSMAVFVFLSGYELFVDCSTSDEIKTFARKKLLPLCIINIVLVLAYYFWNRMVNRESSTELIIKSLTFGDSIIENGWFIQIQIWYYIVSYFVWRFFKSKNWILWVSALSVTYIILCYSCELPIVYYEYILFFAAGMVCYKNGKAIEILMKDKMPGMAHKIVILYTCRKKEKIDVGWKYIQILGVVSLEIYMFSGLFSQLFHSDMINISNPFFYMLLVLIVTIVCACLFHRVAQRVYDMCGKVSVTMIKDKVLYTAEQIVKKRNACEKFKKEIKHKFESSALDDPVFAKWKACWDSRLNKVDERQKYMEFSCFLERRWIWLDKKIKRNKKRNFCFKGMYILSFVILGLLYLFFFLSPASKIPSEEGVISRIGENWAVFLTFPVFSIAIAKWIDIKKYQETWVRHYMQKALLEDEMYKYIYSMEPYDKNSAEMTFIEHCLDIKRANDVKFIENMEQKEQSITDLLNYINVGKN